jgi:hypothetical protein
VSDIFLLIDIPRYDKCYQSNVTWKHEDMMLTRLLFSLTTKVQYCFNEIKET